MTRPLHKLLLTTLLAAALAASLFAFTPFAPARATNDAMRASADTSQSSRTYLSSATTGTSSGPVTGRIIARDTYEMGFCSTACLNVDNVGYAPGHYTGDPLSPPDYYKLKVPRAGGDFQTKGPVQVGTYRIAFDGIAHDPDRPVSNGYLELLGNGKWTLVDSFSKGTPFTVTTDETVNVGTLNIDYATPFILDNGSFTATGAGGFYDSAHKQFHASGIPKGAKLTIYGYGCDKLRTKQVFRKSGSFYLTWKDGRAYHHYKRNVTIEIVMSGRSIKPRVLITDITSVKQFHWKCI